MIKLSIIIPVYNAEKTISATLDSCLNQTYSNIEIICVNDCSTDTTQNILNEYAKKNTCIQLINLKENMNLYMARKTGINYAKGDYVLFLDSDDTLCLSACELLNKKLIKRQSDIVCFGYKTLPDENIFIPQSINNPEKYLLNFMKAKTNIPSVVWSRAYKLSVLRDSFANLPDFNAFMAEDVYITIAVLHYAKSMDTCKRPLINYFTGGKSRIYTDNFSIYNSYIKSYNIILNEIKKFLYLHNSPFMAFYSNVVAHLLSDFFNLLPHNIAPDKKIIILDMLYSILDKEIFSIFLFDAQKRADVYNTIAEDYLKKGNVLQVIKFFIKLFKAWFFDKKGYLHEIFACNGNNQQGL
jgi:glycosyltransferase involved in cell wall biosynthesis